MPDKIWYHDYQIVKVNPAIEMVIQKISFGNLPKLSRGKNQLAHRILRTQFS